MSQSRHRISEAIRRFAIVGTLLTVAVRPAVAQNAVDYERAVKAAYEKYKDLHDGKNADYIPALAKVDANLFGIALITADGKVYKLDASGNAKASTALKGNPDAKNPMATISGSMEGQTVKVDSISVR